MYYLAVENNRQLNDPKLHKDIIDLLHSIIDDFKEINQSFQDNILGESAMRINSNLRRANMAFYTSSQTSGGPTIDRFSPLEKEVRKESLRFAIHLLIVMSQFTGDGIELANTVKPHNHPQILRSAAHNYEVGSFPDFFKPDIDAYAHDDILDLIVFYGLGFGIKAGDSLEERIAKFRRFLTRG